MNTKPEAGSGARLKPNNPGPDHFNNVAEFNPHFPDNRYV